jgi:hypothetical protein
VFLGTLAVDAKGSADTELVPFVGRRQPVISAPSETTIDSLTEMCQSKELIG